MNRNTANWEAVHERLAAFARVLKESGEQLDAQHHLRMVERTKTFALLPPTPAGACLEVLSFSIGAERYALETRHVGEVAALTHCVPLPNLPAHVQGIVHLRGRMVSVLDLRVLFGMPIGDLPERNYLVVLRSDAMEFGVLAHGVDGTVKIETASLIKDLPNLDDVRARYLLGITSDRRVILDGARMLEAPELIVNQNE